MKYTVDMDISKGMKKLDDLERRQAPFAISRAINDVAEGGRDKIVDDLDDKFTLRKAWWKPRSRFGFNVARATKRHLQAKVFTRAPWMRLQEAGGTKKPKGRHLAIPTDAIWKNPSRVLPKGKRPRQLLDKPGKRRAFIVRTHGRNDREEGIFRRYGKKRYPLERLFYFEKQVDIKETLKFKATMSDIVARRFVARFRLRLRQAVASSKR